MKDDLDAREQNAMVQAIRNLMETTKWSLEKAMDSLKIPPEQRDLYANLVKGA